MQADKGREYTQTWRSSIHPNMRRTMQALSVLAKVDAELLEWHLQRVPRAVPLLIGVAAACRGCCGDEDGIWQVCQQIK